MIELELCVAFEVCEYVGVSIYVVPTEFRHY